MASTTKLDSMIFFLFLLVRFCCGDDNKLWCVAKNNAEDSALQSAIDWACGPGGANCSPIQAGGQCFEPQDLQYHASYAFNDYFVRNGFALSACDFSGTAAPISLDPSHDNCIFPSSSSARNGNFSGSTTGSGTGVGPADMTGASSLQLKSSLSTLSMVILIMATTAYSSLC